MSISHDLRKEGAKAYILFNDSIVDFLQPIVYPPDSKIFEGNPVEAKYLDSTSYIKLNN